jgi:hypothetical protein
MLRSYRYGAIIASLTLLLGTISANRAQAEPLTVYAGNISWGSSNSTGQLITFSYTHGNTTTNFSNAYAGQVLASFVTPQRVGDFVMYCVDLNHDFYVPSHWPINVNTTGMVYGSPVNNADKISFLVETYGETRLDANHSAALQAAIWEAEYGKNFKLNEQLTSSSIVAEYHTYLNSIPGSGLSVSSLWLDPQGQTNLGQWPQGEVTAAPEPASLLLIGGGSACCAVGAYLRRKRTTAATLAAA